MIAIPFRRTSAIPISLDEDPGPEDRAPFEGARPRADSGYMRRIMFMRMGYRRVWK